MTNRIFFKYEFYAKGILLWVFCAFFIVLKSNAQEVFQSEEEKFSYQNSYFSVVGKMNNQIYTYTASKEGYFLNIYNDSMKITAKVNLDFFPSKIFQTEFISYEDFLIVFYVGEVNRNAVQYAAVLNEKGLLTQDPIAIDTSNLNQYTSDKNYSSVSVSPDKSKIFLTRLDRQNRFSGILMDNQLNILKYHQEELKNDESIQVLQTLLNNNGQFYFSAGFGKNKQRNYNEISLFEWNLDGISIFEFPLTLDKSYVSGLHLKIDHSSQDIYGAGFYADKKSRNADGVFYFLFNTGGSAFKDQKKIGLSQDILNAVDVQNKKNAMNDFHIRDIILKKSGGFLLIAEHYYVTMRTSQALGYGYYSWYYNNFPMAGRSVREFHYGDILNIDFDEQGKDQWHTFIRKEQYSQEDNGMFSSFALMNTGGNLVFLFNNFSARNSFLNLSVLNKNGDIQFSRFNPGNKFLGDWIPRDAKQTDVKEWIIPVLKRNNLSFTRLVF